MHNILIIKIGALGDVLRTTCILPGLKNKFPDAVIHWITAPGAEPLLSYNPLIDHVILQKEATDNNRTVLPDYDLVINLDDDQWACDLSVTIEARNFVGAYSRLGEIEYTPDSADWFDMSLVSRFGKRQADRLKKRNRRTYPEILFSILGIKDACSSLIIPEQYRDRAKFFSRDHFVLNHPVIGLSTGAGRRWRFKQLSEKKTALLAEYSSKTFSPNILLLGGQAEKERNRTIEDLARCSVINSGNDHCLLAFSALVELCDLVVTSDSLTLHIATALKIPAVTFFGPTSAHEIDLFGQGEKIIPDIPCICCYLTDCDIRPTCMDKISIEAIGSSMKFFIPTHP